MRIEVTQCSMCKHYSEEQYCEIWQQYITNDAFYCACGVKADRKTENSSEIPNNCEPQTDYGDYERAVDQMQHDMRYEPTYNAEDWSM